MSPLDRLFDRAVRRKRDVAAAAFLAAGALTAGLVVTVHSGNTLSGIAAQHCGGHANDWTGIYAANKAVIGADPNLIMPGQRLTVRCSDPANLLALGSGSHHASSGKTWNVTYGYPNFCGDGDGDGWDVACASGPTRSGTTAFQAPSTSGAAGMPPALAQCIISRESGGNLQAVNPSSGAGGKWQFLPSTWAGLGYSGLPQNAPGWEQDQAAARLYATARASPWAADGCPGT